jgi:hypothetical protein
VFGYNAAALVTDAVITDSQVETIEAQTCIVPSVKDMRGAWSRSLAASNSLTKTSASARSDVSRMQTLTRLEGLARKVWPMRDLPFIFYSSLWRG